MVHLLPHQRYDLYQKAVNRLSAMADCLLNHSLCKDFVKVCQANVPRPQASLVQPVQVTEEVVPGQLFGHDQLAGAVEEPGDVHPHDDVHDVQTAGVSSELSGKEVSDKRVKKKKAAAEKCPWTRNHESKASLKKDKTIQNLSVTDRFGIPAAGLQVITRRTNKDILANNKEDVVDKTDKKLLELAKDISQRLTQDVFSNEGKVMIENTRILLDLPSLAMKIKSQESCLKVALMEFPRWQEAIEQIPVDELKDIPRDELKGQFKLFLVRLEKLSEKFSIEELEMMDTRVLIKEFFDEKKLLYTDIEMVLHAMAVASVKHSCESILESFVSKYENHFDERRNVDEVTANEEFEICVNGPNLANSEAVIKEAMDLHWGSKSWHFYRTSRLDMLINPSGVSNTIKRLTSTKNKLPIMD